MRGAAALLTAQFLFEDFSPHVFLVAEGYGSVFDAEYEPAIGSFLGVKLPINVPESERYEFACRAARSFRNRRILSSSTTSTGFDAVWAVPPAPDLTAHRSGSNAQTVTSAAPQAKD